MAGDRRLLLVLDDLQWADRSTRQLLLYLLAGLGDVQLSVLAAVRAESLHGTHPLRRVLAELRRLRSVRVVDLLAAGPRRSTLELVTAIAGAEVEPEDADRVFKRSGGNPFVVEELARDLRDGRVELSDTLREIFLSRVDELPPNAHAVVHAVAAGVEPVEHARAGPGAAGCGEEQLIDAVRAAVAHRFVVSAADGYRLRHRLVAEMLEHEVLPAEQTRPAPPVRRGAGSGRSGRPRPAGPPLAAGRRAAPGRCRRWSPRPGRPSGCTASPRPTGTGPWRWN